MFQSIFKRAEGMIEQSIGQLVVRIIMAVPFMIAAGFGISALSTRVNREYGAEAGHLMMAGIFFGLGVVVALVVAMRKPQPGAATADAEATGPAPGAEQTRPADGTTFSDVDRELVLAALTSAAPIAVPYLARLILRNLPLVAAVAASIFVMTRPTSSQVTPPTAAE